jgi:hypothetical protein
LLIALIIEAIALAKSQISQLGCSPHIGLVGIERGEHYLALRQSATVREKLNPFGCPAHENGGGL